MTETEEPTIDLSSSAVPVKRDPETAGLDDARSPTAPEAGEIVNVSPFLGLSSPLSS